MPDSRTLGLDKGVLTEDPPGRDRLLLWRSRGHHLGQRRWERIGSVPRAAVVEDAGLCAVAATADAFLQPVILGLSRVLGLLRGARKKDETWVLPDGSGAIPEGQRRRGLALVWRAGQSGPLDESAVRSRWPSATGLERLGAGLWLVEEGPREAAVETAESPDEETCPRGEIERRLRAARGEGDPRAEMLALFDLGSLDLRGPTPLVALRSLEEALRMACQLDERAVQAEALTAIGEARLAAGEPAQARRPLEQAWAIAYSRQDGHAEALILPNLALVDAASGNMRGALVLLTRTVELAVELGDRVQQARSLWARALAHDALGDRAAASVDAKVSADLLREAGHPEAPWYDEHVRQYDQASAPDPLRMALMATQAMTRSIASGLKTAPVEVRRQRSAACASCEHHTGARCRLCGCFTKVKAGMAHERCPLGRWD
jgi:hypothetical protein